MYWCTLFFLSYSFGFNSSDTTICCKLTENNHRPKLIEIKMVSHRIENIERSTPSWFQRTEFWPQSWGWALDRRYQFQLILSSFYLQAKCTISNRDPHSLALLDMTHFFFGSTLMCVGPTTRVAKFAENMAAPCILGIIWIFIFVLILDSRNSNLRTGSGSIGSRELMFNNKCPAVFD